MGRRGNPYTNARAESFLKTFKVEAVYPMACARHAPRPVPEPGTRSFWRAREGTDFCAEGLPRMAPNIQRPVDQN